MGLTLNYCAWCGLPKSSGSSSLDGCTNPNCPSPSTAVPDRALDALKQELDRLESDRWELFHLVDAPAGRYGEAEVVGWLMGEVHRLSVLVAQETRMMNPDEPSAG